VLTPKILRLGSMQVEFQAFLSWELTWRFVFEFLSHHFISCEKTRRLIEYEEAILC